MDEGVPSLMWDGYSRPVFYRMQSFHPPSTFHAVSSSSITSSMRAPPSPGLESPFLAGASVNPASSLMPGSGVGGAVDKCL